MPQPHVQVVLAADGVPEALRTALREMRVTASFWPLSEALRRDLTSNVDAIVLVLPAHLNGLSGALRVLFDRLADHPRAVLALSPDGTALPRLEHPPTLPVLVDRGADAHDLQVRLTMMLEMRESLDSLHRGLVTNRRTGESVAKRYASQLRLASQVQRGFMPQALPELDCVSFEVVFRPVDYVSGDIYDIQRLDEEHVGIAVADASGHGIPAALLTVYIKRALRGKEIERGSYRILAPNQVLAGLNHDILDAGLTDCPFVAAAYAVLNTRTLELTLARGGTPYPIYRTAQGDIEVLDVPGSVVGVVSDARFELRTLQLSRGDSVLFYTDGLERLVAPARPETHGAQTPEVGMYRIDAADAPALDDPMREPGEPGADTPWRSSESAVVTQRVLERTAAGVRARTRVSAPDRTPIHVADTPWGSLLRRHGPAAALRQVARRQRMLRRMGFPLDDLTLVAIQIRD